VQIKVFSDVGFWFLLAVRRLNGTVRSMFSGVFSGFLLEGIDDKQKIKGAVKQCIEWVDTLIARKSIMLNVVCFII